MPSFEIPDGPTTVALKKEGGFHKGSAVFGVTNKTGEGLTARFSVQVQGDGKAEWYQVQGEPERPVAAGETQTVTVVGKIPAATPPGQHRIKLRAINVNDPDNDSTDSAAATVTVPAAAAPPPKKPFPWWILAVVGGVLVLVIGAIIAIVAMSGGSKIPNVVGQPYAEAVKALDKAGYKIVKRANKQTGDKPPETVLDQAPAAEAKTKKTETVLLTVAMPMPVVVPDEPKEEPPIEQPAEANCDPAIGACVEGFVWREAWPGDRVCVTPESRYLAAQENAQAAARRSPYGGAYGPDTCLQGYVWRDGFVGDHVCVSGERRSVVAQENAAGPSRYRACRPKIVIPRPRIPGRL
ncbi:PASTA domain-containing protein [Caulobacter sp. UNC279MFTsu5.1]|uniref:PASTA domain-containing protein n=1 Tax=Caulobacter sp. UNC279MFTsu5.1 TaxID=1502775 RepID=UPI00036E3655|nr:PASTA domain-containing protein [Caulobacter sp. UNC279MFTsu5.1]SFK35353.1 PASTA domain-containing protein [Caulobacter sp. UNC279MFTsu5.1]